MAKNKVMRLASIVYLIFSILISCTSKPKMPEPQKCLVKYDSLFKGVDTSGFEIVRNTDSAAVEVLDHKTPGQRCLFRFDENGNLRFYAFLNNEHNDTNFYIKCDSTGEMKRSTSHEIIQWTFFKRKDSVLRFEFYLCALDYNFGHIQIKAGKYQSGYISLFETNFLKLIGAKIRINLSDLDSTGMIYISGRKQDKCSKVYSEFLDSTAIPTDF